MATTPVSPGTITTSARTADSRKQLLVCSAALLVGVATWLVAIRSPLWLDETWTYWQISGGLHEVWARNVLTFTDAPGYIYLLLAWVKLFGAREFVLRTPSALAMVGVLLLFYRTARIFLGRQASLLATLLLAAEPVVAFAAIDARPYAFALFATSATIYLLFRYRSGSIWSALSIGCTAATIPLFHYLFAGIIPLVLLCMILLHVGSRQALAKKLAFACLPSILVAAALIPVLLRMLHTRSTDVFETKPALWQLLFALVPLETGFAFVVTCFTSLLTRNRLSGDRSLKPSDSKWLTASLLLGLPPILALFAVSTLTSIHMFTPRFYLVALPGCALASAILIQKVFDPSRQTLFCFALACMVGIQSLLPAAKHHGYTWKYALAAADANAASDRAPLVICSDFPQADFASMSVPYPKTSWLYAQLSYYPVHTTVIPMPRTLNAEAIKSGRLFLSDAAAHHQRFLATGYLSSAGILNWLMQNAVPNYRVRLVGDFDHVRVLEFDPR